MKIKKIFNLKELFYFEIIFDFFFIRPTDPTFRGGGQWETKHFIGMALVSDSIHSKTSRFLWPSSFHTVGVSIFATRVRFLGIISCSLAAF